MDYKTTSILGEGGLQRFSTDVAFNIASIFIIGISGLLLNIIIASIYGPSVVGMFNQVLAIYIILGQIAPLGLHLSVLHFLPLLENQHLIQRKIFSSALSITALTSFFICFVLLFSVSIIGQVLESVSVERGLVWAIPGLWCFTINKVLLGSLNAIRHMKMFAFAQTLRVVAWVAAMCICVSVNAPIHVLPVVLTFGDALLLSILIPYTVFYFGFTLPNHWKGWATSQFRFGGRVMCSGLIMEMNTKTDVIMLGIWCSDHLVGIYSFASMLFEGLSQFPGILRENINPLLSKLFKNKSYNEIKMFIRRINIITIPIMTAIVVFITIIYSWFVMTVTNNPDFVNGKTVFIILGLGLVIGSGFIPFQMLLNQSGHPTYFTIFVFIVLLSNIGLNMFMIPLWQGIGAATATAVSFSLAPLFLVIISRMVLKEWII